MILTSTNFVSLKELQSNHKKSTFSFECLIHNQEYGFEFMYDSNDIFNFSTSATTAYLYPLEHVPSFSRVRWLIQPSKNGSSLETILIKSYKSNKYLCASGRHLERFMKRRKVYLSNRFEKETCEWKLEIVDPKEMQDNHNLGMKSYIINVKYDEPLYAQTFFFKKDQFKRNLYLWHDKNDKRGSKQFNWIIECLDINFNKV